jgi:hypothetical protein
MDQDGSRGGRGERSERDAHDSTISPRASAGIKSATPGLGTGAQLEEAASACEISRQPFDEGRNASDRFARLHGPAAEGPPCTEISYEFRRKR